jgi:hypothetical protein
VIAPTPHCLQFGCLRGGAERDTDERRIAQDETATVWGKDLSPVSGERVTDDDLRRGLDGQPNEVSSERRTNFDVGHVIDQLHSSLTDPGRKFLDFDSVELTGRYADEGFNIRNLGSRMPPRVGISDRQESAEFESPQLPEGQQQKVADAGGRV